MSAIIENPNLLRVLEGQEIEITIPRTDSSRLVFRNTLYVFNRENKLWFKNDVNNYGLIIARGQVLVPGNVFGKRQLDIPSGMAFCVIESNGERAVYRSTEIGFSRMPVSSILDNIRHGSSIVTGGVSIRAEKTIKWF